MPTNESNLKQTIESALKAFANQPLAEAATATDFRTAARDFFAVLGYTSPRTLDTGGSPDVFLSTFASSSAGTGRGTFNPAAALVSDWRSAHLLFQLTDTELSGENSLFKEDFERARHDSYIFFAIELSGPSYTRTQLATITRQLNRLFPQPVMVLFKTGAPTLTLAVINRRANLRDSEKDVLGKVTLIRDINILTPHRGHLDILASLAVPSLSSPMRSDHTPIRSFAALHAAWEKLFNVQLLNKSFYTRLTAWYGAALGDIHINLDAAARILGKSVDNELRPQAVIRIIVRMLFIWFMKEKRLIDGIFFTRQFAAEFVKQKDGYYNAVLQNLFFAVLNKKISERRFRKEDPKHKYDPETNDYGTADTLRHRAFFHDGKADAFLARTQQIPFVNGGLFICHDYKFSGKDAVTNKRNVSQNYIIDGFSDNPRDRATLSDAVLFQLIDLFNDYVFTIEESTPTEQEIALDPELLGTVFENLIGSYNPETQETARKQTGSFYTPREIVDYMCKETLAVALAGAVPSVKGGFAALLESHEDQLNFPQKTAVIAAITNLKILDPACGSGAFPMGMFLLMVRTIEKLQEHKTTYKNKLDIIQNCIYGVDIQNIAIEIAKLRFFISLLVDYPVPENPENFDVLPNLETKFAIANTLVGLDIQLGDLFASSLAEECKKLTAIFTPFTTAKTTKEKTRIKNEFETEKTKLVTLFEKHHFDQGEIEKIRAWNPFNVSYGSPFFDPAIMFGIADGFDIVIGNPPYVFARNSKSKGMTAQNKEYFYTNYTLSEYQINLYPLFIEAGTRFLTPSGILSFITPNNWLTLNTNKKLRRFVLEKSNITIVNFYKRAFESADVDSAIVIFQNTTTKTDEPVRIAEWEGQYNVLGEIPKSKFLSKDDCVINIEAVKGNEVFTILEQIENNTVLLAQIGRVKCGLGAYGHGDGIPPQTKEMIKKRVYHSTIKKGVDWFKYIEGEDVKRYACGWSHREYLKYGKHLREPRNDWNLFSTPRILVRQIPSPLPYCINACYVEETFLNDRNSMNIVYLSVPAKALLAVLNSRAVSWWFAHNFGKLQRGIFPQFKINELAKFPIPKTLSAHEAILTALVSCIMAAKRLDETVIADFIDHIIDACVFELYFPEHMAERNLLFFDKLKPDLANFNPDSNDETQRAFLQDLHATHNAPKAKIRNQLLRLAADSPDLLGIILKG